MRRIFPKTRMGLFALFLLVLWILKSLFLNDGLRRALPSFLAFGLDLLTPMLALPAVYYSVQIFSLIRRKLLWKIRRRLILAHIFIGAIPVLLIIIIVYVASLLFYYQISYYLISSQIAIHEARVHSLNLSLMAGLREAMATASAPTALNNVLNRDAKYVLGTYPTATIILRCVDPAAKRTFVFGSGIFNAGKLKDYQIPWWLRGREFKGLVLENAQPGIYESDSGNLDKRKQSRLFVRSLILNDNGSGHPFSIEISVPFDRHFLDQLKAAVGQDLLLADHVTISSLNIMLQSTNILQQNILFSTFDSENNQRALNRPVWSMVLIPFSWSAGSEIGMGESDVLFVELSTSRLFQNILRSESNGSRTILEVLKFVVAFFLLVECISLIIGILLTKSITHAVYNLYRGTEFVKRGDFSHRIKVKYSDQLGALATSFNQMTEYVQSLVKERVQKERLERELEIAKEVQEQLFPRKAPKMGKIELTGLCLPARIVSGDYYDFLPFGAHRLGMALGDICGKGISAALLMANLQATLRSTTLRLPANVADSGEKAHDGDSVAGVVQMINRQIYNYTSANKFASFFYAVYDELAQTLTYCNAGHNPPLYFNGNKVKRLTVGGTVVGIFGDVDYDQETLFLQSGDILLAYTDGIIECVNEYGEEFGERRLTNLVQHNRHLTVSELQEEIVRHVLSWAHEEERDDDMTLVIAKFR